MATEIRCAACGETEALRGERDGSVINVTCERCGDRWIRDLERKCGECGEALRPVPKAIAARSRGNQKSIAGTMTVYLCPSCDHEMLERHQRSRAPITPDEWTGDESG